MCLDSTQPKPRLGLELMFFKLNHSPSFWTYRRSGSLCFHAGGIRWETKWWARNKSIKIRCLWEMQVGSQGGSAQRIRKSHHRNSEFLIQVRVHPSILGSAADTRQAEDMGGSIPGRPHRVLLGHDPSSLTLLCFFPLPTCAPLMEPLLNLLK